MSRKKVVLFTFSVLALALTAPPLWGQGAWGGRGLGLYGLGPRLGENVTLALELRDELGLSGDQVEALQALDLQVQEDVGPLDAEIQALRSQILAGEVVGAQGLLQLEELLAQYQVAADPYRAEVARILTPEQHRLLQVTMFETRPGVGYGYGYGYGLGRGAVGVGYRGRPGWGAGPGLGYGRGAGYGVGYGRGVGRAGRFYGRGIARGGRRIRW